MLGDNIKKYRRERGYTQEELAAKLHVVRQTLSKWENHASVPDAEVLMELSKALEVPVSVLLDLTPKEEAVDLNEELARVNQELAERNQQLKRNTLASQKRGQIVFLSFAALMAVILVNHPVVSLLLVVACLVLALGILYRNLALFSERAVSVSQMRTLKVVTVFNAVFLIGLVAVCGLLQAQVITLTAQQERWLLMGVFSFLFLFFGALSPRLPYQRHTGLRLPWTVQDEDTWNLAHRILGVISLPITLLYLAAAVSVSELEHVGTISVIALMLYIGIPGVISLVYFWKKYH